MKRFLFIFIFITQFYFSQKNTSLIMVQYSESVTQTPSTINNYVGTLFIENNLTYYRSEYKNTETDNSKEESDVVVFKNQKTIPPNEILSNKNELVENKYEARFLKKSFSIVELYPKFNWKILPGERKFNNMVCKNATTTFRGRTYTAWFTEEVPITAGPWKFNGLPGLILYVQDNEGMYKWQLTNIQSPYKGNNINLKDAFTKRNKYTKISYKEFDKKFIDAIENKIEIVAARNLNRGGIKSRFSFTTLYEKEPTNEWRTQTYFD